MLMVVDGRGILVLDFLKLINIIEFERASTRDNATFIFLFYTNSIFKYALTDLLLLFFEFI